MKLTIMLVCIFVVAGAQTLPTLPPVNTVSVQGVTCTFSVLDSKTALGTECIDATGEIKASQVHTPSENGALPGWGPILCLYWLDQSGDIRLQCSGMEADETVRKLIDGKLAPVTKKKRWYLLWR